jgi:membrane protein YqaA with SNARE-associated domain
VQEWFGQLAAEHGIWGLFAAALVSATLLPGGSELLLVALLLDGSHPPLLLWLSATAGNTLGGMVNWAIGRGLLPLTPDQPRLAHARASLQRHGAPLLTLSWLPLIGDPLCLAAGWLAIDWRRALLWIALGKGVRYLLVIVGVAL